jgi:UDP-glucose 4-epimerase
VESGFVEAKKVREILIFGSKGFIGHACAAFFSGKANVTGCDIMEAEEKGYFQLKHPGDIENIVAGKKYDVCINASGSANVGFSFTHTDIDYQLNVENVKRMLNAIGAHNKECRFLNF